MQWQSRFAPILCMALARLERGIENAKAEPLRADALLISMPLSNLMD